jgi:Flp pilus assembly protein TadG
MRKLQTFLYRFYSDHSGTIAVFTALSLTALTGFAGLGVEAAQWYSTKRAIQAAADDAALSAAVAYGQGNTSGYVSDGKSVAGANGFVDGVNNVSVAVTKPPQSGAYANNNSAVQVTIVSPVQPILSAMFISDFDISATSVALINGTSSNGCVLALNAAAAGAGTVSGTSTNISLNHCSFDVNSKNAAALTMSGGSSLSAADVILGGNDSIANNATLTVTDAVRINQPAVADPYASRTIPTPGTCNGVHGPIGGTVTLSPGTYCGNNAFKINGGASVTLNPGVYILDQTDFNIAGGASVTGTGVTIILTSSGSFNNVGNIIINGGSTVNLTAPTSGTYSGMVFWQDGRAPDANKDNFSGGTSMTITGAIYMPSQTVSFSGGNGTNGAGGTGCTQLIANIINFNGNSQFANNCTGVGTSPITASSALALLGQ